MFLIKKMRTILVLTSICLLVCPVAGIWAANSKVLHIYDDSWHYQPTGWMAEDNHIDAMTMNSYSPDNPAEGSACVKITYDPNLANWVGFYVQASGKWRANGGTGINMSGYSAMIIKARAADSNASAIEIQFGVGGDTASLTNKDSCNVKTNWTTLNTTWQTFTIDLSNQGLNDINGLVVVTMRRILNVDPVIYIDDIQFVGPGPASITDLETKIGSVSGSVNLTWTAPVGDYTNTSYIVKYSSNNISNQDDFDNAITYSQSWVPGTSGTTESQAITGLTPGQWYYFAIETKDSEGNQSGLSNVCYALARDSGLGILVNGIVDLGIMSAGETKSGGPITVTNIGGMPMTASLSITNPPGWTADSDNSAKNHYILLGAFASSENSFLWDVAAQVLTTESVKCTSTRFAGDQTGVAVPLDAVRNLWIRFTAPLMLDIGTFQQEIIVNMTAESVD